MTLRPQRASSALVALVAVLFSFVTTVVWTRDEDGDTRAARREELVGIVEARQRRTAILEERLAALRARVDRLSSGDDEQLRKLRALVDDAAALSGGTAIDGPGYVVTLADAPDAKRDRLDSDSRILDVDIQAVVNELWAAGAEAIAVNGQRIIATTAIRNAGAAVLVNYRILSSPYRIEAIGPSETIAERFEASAIAGHFREWSSIYGLGFEATADPDLRLPAYGGSIRFRYARPIEED